MSLCSSHFSPTQETATNCPKLPQLPWLAPTNQLPTPLLPVLLGLSLWCGFSCLLYQLVVLVICRLWQVSYSRVMGKVVSFDPSHIVLTAGAATAIEILCFCLADHGNAFLNLTPYYPGQFYSFEYKFWLLVAKWEASCSL